MFKGLVKGTIFCNTDTQIWRIGVVMNSETFQGLGDERFAYSAMMWARVMQGNSGLRL